MLCAREDSNFRPSPCKGAALAKLSYARRWVVNAWRLVRDLNEARSKGSVSVDALHGSVLVRQTKPFPGQPVSPVLWVSAVRCRSCCVGGRFRSCDFHRVMMALRQLSYTDSKCEGWRRAPLRRAKISAQGFSAAFPSPDNRHRLSVTECAHLLPA